MRLSIGVSFEQRVRSLVTNIADLGRYQKRAILAINDYCALSAALWLAMSLRLSTLYVPQSWPLFLLFASAPAVAVGVGFRLRVYRHVTRRFGRRGAGLILAAVTSSSLFLALMAYFAGIIGVPRTVVILYPILGTVAVWGTRLAAAGLFDWAGLQMTVMGKQRSVLIYGAGPTGVQLLQALRCSGGYAPVAFVDANPTLWGQYVDELRVHEPAKLAGLIERHEVTEVLLAMPKAFRRERRAALRQLEGIKVTVRTLPAMEDLAAGRVTVSDLHDVEAEDLLGRDPIPPNPALMAGCIEDKSVLVTGAGGSIGSELVRQILQHSPHRLVLLERGEEQLYEIGLRVDALLEAGQEVGRQPTIVSVLGSVQDAQLVQNTIKRHGIQTIYHAAAFKHVPMLEHNAVVGVRNNTFGTNVLAEAAEACGVERFVLISTDKAVRPTSVMGASKRLAEMILQARAAEARGTTVFTMVRFGNVLDSSGSVVRRFRQQIRRGGPATVTHPDVVRYFMSIPEAAALVIQAGAMATGGEVFVLDMGEPVRIDDLARSMIRLMGLEVRDAHHPDGDIAIEYIGLRDGEKLHEELLLGENSAATEHPRIFKSREPYLPPEQLKGVLKRLNHAITANDGDAVRAVLAEAVEGFQGRPIYVLRSAVPSSVASDRLGILTASTLGMDSASAA